MISGSFYGSLRGWISAARACRLSVTQEPHSGHDAVAIDYAEAGLGQMQLKARNVIGGRRVGGALEECRKAFAALNAAALRTRSELARLCSRSCADAAN